MARAFGRRCRPDGPSLRDRVKSRFDLLHREGKQLATHCTEVSSKIRPTKRDADSLVACGEAESRVHRRTGSQEDGETIPPVSAVATEQAARHEDGDRYALGLSNRQRIAEVVAVAIVEGHDNSGPTRWRGQVVERRWFTSTDDLLQVRGEVLGTHTQSKRILDPRRDPVVAEDEGSAMFHGAHAPIGRAVCTRRATPDRTRFVSPPNLRPSRHILAVAGRGRLGSSRSEPSRGWSTCRTSARFSLT